MKTHVLRKLESLERIGIKLGLRNIRVILEALDNPQKSFQSILIAGTNGKGSVGAMLNSILQQQGFVTGHYTSPHLVDVKERIRVSKEIIEPGAFERCLATVFEAIDQMTAAQRLETAPTYFETLTAAAFLHFQQQKVQLAIVEVGLGGRFDATNVIGQSLSIITSIDYDHEEFLGRSLAQIAFEKAGISKPGVPLVTGVIPSEAQAVINKAITEQKCKLYRFEAESISNFMLSDGFPVFDYVPWSAKLRINLRGRHQAFNAGVAITACEALTDAGFKITHDSVIRGLETVHWPARLDLLCVQPPVLLDCAHNPMGVRSLAEFLKETGWGKNVALFTAMKDKKITSMIHQIAPLLQEVFLTSIEPLSRCASQAQLEQACSSVQLPFQYHAPVVEAMNFATRKAAHTGSPLIIFGSIYLAGEILRLTGLTSTA